jgi:DNA-binding transcriptional MerR regulator
MFTFHLKGTPFKTGFDLSNLSITEISTLLKDYRKDPEAEEANIKKLEDMIKARAQKVARQRNKEKIAEEKEKKAETEAAESSSSNQGEKKAETIEGSLTNPVESKDDTIGASSSSLMDHCDAPNV